MKFEELLPILRSGGKVRLKSYDEDGEYWIAGYIGFPDFYDDDGKFVTSEKTLTIHRMTKNDEVIRDKNGWGISRWAVMAEDWEILE